LADRAKESSLFSDRKIEIIPTGLNTRVYRPIDAEIGRKSFDLPADKHLILFGAQEVEASWKGFGLLRRALALLNNKEGYDDVNLVVFGSSRPADPPDFAFETHYTGYVHDDATLASLYAACDVMVVPSKIEAFGQTVTESMACGTPVVGFDATGPRDTIEHGVTGYLAEPYDADDLAEGIGWVLDDPELRSMMGKQARARAVEQYDIETVALQYHALYENILA
jgi:glycosyltransferase involved in cell wall biosynthesis